MHTTSLTVCREGWRAFVVRPSGVEHTSPSTEFNSIVKCPGSQEIPGLCLLEPGKQLEPHYLPRFKCPLAAS